LINSQPSDDFYVLSFFHLNLLGKKKD